MNAGKTTTPRSRRLIWRVLDWIDYIIVGAVVLVALALCFITFWLTPSRLSGIIDTQASKILNADVRTGPVSFTFWSTFPHFCVVADSVHVESRNLLSIPESVRSQLPENPDFLVSTGRVEGGINIAKLMKGEIWLRDVVVDSLRLNLVAVNDTLNNYTLMPESGKSEMPYFNIDRLSFVDGGEVTYYSHLSRTSAKVTLQEASLSPRKGKNDYHLMFKGKLFARSGGLNLLRGFPFELDGDVNVRFKPFGISTSDYVVNLGAVKGIMGMDLDLGNNMRLNNFDYHLTDFTLEDLRTLLPAGYADMFSRVDANLELEATAGLTSPYNFSSGYLPSLEVDFRIPDGEIGYTFSDNRRYAVNQVGLLGRFVFDGRHPEASYIDISRLHVEGLGADINARAIVRNLTETPRVSINAEGRGDLGFASANIPQLAPLRMAGVVDFKAGVDFNVEGSQIRESDISLSVRSDRLGLHAGNYDLDLQGFSASTSESYPDLLSWSTTVGNLPFNLNISADNVTVSDAGQSDAFHIAGMNANVSLNAEKNENYLRQIGLKLGGATIDMKTPGFSAAFNNVSLDLDADNLKTLSNVADYVAPAQWTADASSMSRVNHTPEFVRVQLPANLLDLIRRWQVSLNMKSERGVVAIDNYRLGVADVDLIASIDSVRVNNIAVSHGDTHARIKADISNLRQFMSSKTPAPLFVTADVAVDTAEINQLARNYTLSHPKSAIARGDKTAMAAGVDTVSIIMPRNIRADVHASAARTIYTNLRLDDLSADIRLADGVLNVDTAHVSSDFGQASLKFMYDTSDLQDLKMTTGLRLYDVELTDFFRNFPKLLALWPEMNNLSGTLSMGLDGRVHIFPSMNVNMPSLWANVGIEGKGLQINQNNFIKHLAHMLLIFQEGPIDIHDIKVQAVVHSNLVELFPTTFEVSKYKLVLMGLNNFNGDLYYHVGIENWPLKMPFGVNVKGSYQNPQLRFGGKNWKDRNGALIAGGVQDSFNFNLTRSARQYGGEFIHSAAAYQE